MACFVMSIKELNVIISVKLDIHMEWHFLCNNSGLRTYWNMSSITNMHCTASRKTKTNWRHFKESLWTSLSHSVMAHLFPHSKTSSNLEPERSMLLFSLVLSEAFSHQTGRKQFSFMSSVTPWIENSLCWGFYSTNVHKKNKIEANLKSLQYC